MHVWLVIKGFRPSRLASMRRPLVALTALAAAGALAAGCGDNNPSSGGSGSGSGGRGYGGSQTSRLSAVATVAAHTSKLAMILVDRPGMLVRPPGPRIGDRDDRGS